MSGKNVTDKNGTSGKVGENGAFSTLGFGVGARGLKLRGELGMGA